MQPTERNLYWQLLDLVRQGTPIARATLVAAWGSTPREVGAKMLVLPDGQIRGTIGGGCGEAEVWQAAQGVLASGEPRRVHVDLTEPLDSTAGKVCGGRFDVFVERWSPSDPATLSLCERLDAALTEGRELRLMTFLGPTPRQSWKKQARSESAQSFPYQPGQTLALGTAGSKLEAELLERSARENAAVLLQQGGADFFVDALLPPPRLVIAGAGHIARPLCEMASLCGYAVTVVDDRPLYARADLFPQARQVICADFTETFKSFPWTSSASAVLVTRGHKHDEDCLRALGALGLAHPPEYIGMIGSKRRVKAVVEGLRQEGFLIQLLDNVYAPIGLDIGAQTPEEIAVCILAEMILVRRGGTGKPMRSLTTDARTARE